MRDESSSGSWSDMGHVRVAGDPQAHSREDDPDLETWRRIVVFRVDPGVPFFLGYISTFSPIPVMCSRVCEGLVGARVGPEDVTFVALAAHDAQPVRLVLVKTTTLDDAEYPDLAYI